MNYSLARNTLFLSLTALSCPLLAQDDAGQAPPPLEISGRVTDGEHKLADCTVITYKDNTPIATATTDRSGKFSTVLPLGETYCLEFRHDGFVAKRIAIDAHLPKLRPDDQVEMGPIIMDVSLLDRARYAGANTDDLDYPFAMVRFDKKTMSFQQDVEYTMSMQRTNGALLLMAAQAEKRK